MIIIIEGPDRVGKSTLSQLLQNHFAYVPLIPIHTAPLKTYDIALKNSHMRALYDAMFRMILMSSTECSFIFDRFHLGEYVYAAKYRNTEGYYAVLMDKFLSARNDCFLFLLKDKAENLLKKEDGKSFSSNIIDKHDEIQRFGTAFSLSSIQNRLIIDVEGKNEFNVFTEALKFIEGKI